jgi:PiT family inorganic phosphate transporter/sulfate permease
MLEIIGTGIATALALNIGANNAGISMGPAAGAGLRSKRAALLWAAGFHLAGAALLGSRGVEHVGRTLLGPEVPEHPAVFLAAAPLVAVALLVLANVLRTPVSTTHAAMASLIGIGMVFEAVRLPKAGEMIGWWIATPLVSAGASWAAGRLLFGRVPEAGRWAGPLLTLAGAYVAFTAGANNAANAGAVLFATGVLGSVEAAFLAGAGMAVGTLLWGSRTLKTVGEGIAELCPARALVVASVAGTVTLAAAWGGIPVSKTLGVTGGLIGLSLAATGARATASNAHVRRILALWTASPLLAVALTYALGALVRR